MVKRHVESLGVDVSLLGFGCMRFPLIDKNPGKIDYPRAQKMIDRAFEMGVNYFDTAWPYHEKQSEVFVGQALSKYPRDSSGLQDAHLGDLHVAPGGYGKAVFRTAQKMPGGLF
jgi:predicted aldo/keto reductase-like oxidoreductase